MKNKQDWIDEDKNMDWYEKAYHRYDMLAIENPNISNLILFRKAIKQYLPRQISREAVEKLREKRDKEIIEGGNMVIIRKDIIKLFTKDLTALLDNGTDEKFIRENKTIPVISYEEAKKLGLLGEPKSKTTVKDVLLYEAGLKEGQIKSEELIEKIMKLALDYVYVDGGHHKQYALVEIIKLIDKSKLPEDIEEGIPD